MARINGDGGVLRQRRCKPLGIEMVEVFMGNQNRLNTIEETRFRSQLSGMNDQAVMSLIEPHAMRARTW